AEPRPDRGFGLALLLQRDQPLADMLAPDVLQRGRRVVEAAQERGEGVDGLAVGLQGQRRAGGAQISQPRAGQIQQVIGGGARGVAHAGRPQSSEANSRSIGDLPWKTSAACMSRSRSVRNFGQGSGFQSWRTPAPWTL